MLGTQAGTILKAKGGQLVDFSLPEGTTPEDRRELLDALRIANAEHLQSRADYSELAARISSYELALALELFSVGLDVLETSAQEERLLRDVVVLALGEALERVDRLVERDELAGLAGELLGHE